MGTISPVSCSTHGKSLYEICASSLITRLFFVAVFHTRLLFAESTGLYGVVPDVRQLHRRREVTQ